MDNFRILDHDFRVYIKHDDVVAAIKSVARQIDANYTNSDRPPVLLITLSGAMMFAAELVQHLSVNHKWAFVKCSSYNDGMTSIGVKIEVEPTASLQGEDVIVIEDIVDTGSTWEFLHKYCLDAGARSVKIATMTIKNEVYKKSLPVDYVGLEIEDKFVVGFGLDYSQQGRNLPHIYQLAD